jgi:hypothetical protein
VRDDSPTIVAPDAISAIASGDSDDRSAGGGDPVELTRHHQAFEFGPQRNEVDIPNAERKPSAFLSSDGEGSETDS